MPTTRGLTLSEVKSYPMTAAHRIDRFQVRRVKQLLHPHLRTFVWDLIVLVGSVLGFSYVRFFETLRTVRHGWRFITGLLIYLVAMLALLVLVA